MTNFLEQGALLRVGHQWHLVKGPFHPSKSPISHAISIFCPDFYDLDKASYWCGSESYALSTEKLESALKEYLQTLPATESPRTPLSQALWHPPRRQDYDLIFDDIQDRIRRGKLHKAVPVLFEKARARVTPRERARFLLRLLHAPPALFIYGFWRQEQGMLGATPETLFTLQGRQLRTMALAGTCPKADARPSLLEDPKEREEHDLVVQDIVEVLSAYGEVRTHGPRLLELPTLWHLKTDIELLCRETPNPRELIRALHPTPALGVFPRKADYHLMRDWPQQAERGAFGAPYAFIFPEEVVCLVAIRNLQWNGEQVRIGAGGGVVAASESPREWRELEQKRESVKKILGLIE